MARPHTLAGFTSSPATGRAPTPSGTRGGARRPHTLADLNASEGGSAPQKKPHKKGKHRSIFGSIVHTISKGGEDLADAAIHAPGGLYHIGYVTGEDIKDRGFFNHTKGHPTVGHDIIAPMARATVQDLRHPLRHPGYTFLDALALASLGAGTAARAGAVAGRVGEGARLGDIAAAAVKRPPIRPRVYHTPSGEPVNLHPARSSLARAVQEGHDVVVRRGMKNRPEGAVARYGHFRAGQATAEGRRVDIGLQRSEARGVKAELGKIPRKQRQVVQDAVRLTSEQTMPEEAIATARRQIAKGHHVEHNQDWIKRLEAVQEAGYLKLDETRPAGHHVHIDAEAHPDVAEVDRKLYEAAKKRDEILLKYGEMTPSGLRERIDAPNVIHAEGYYSKPTKAKLGIATPQLIDKQKRVVRLRKKYDAAVAQSAKRSAAITARGGKPISREEAVNQLAELETAHEKLINKTAERFKGTYPNDAAETMRRNQERARYDRQNSGKSRSGKAAGYSSGKNVVQSRPKTLKEEYRQMAVDKLDELAANHAEEPWAKAYVAQRDRIAELKTKLADTTPGVGEREAVKGEFGHHSPENRLILSSPTVTHYGAALSVAQEELQAAFKAARGRVRPTGMVGKPIRQGRNYVSHAQTEARGGAQPIAGAPGPVIGKAQNIVPKSKPFTGSVIKSGMIPQDTVGMVSRNLMRAYKRANSEEWRAKLARMGSDTKRSHNDVLVSTQEINSKVGDLDRALLGEKDLTFEEQVAHEAGLVDWLEQAVPGVANKFRHDRMHPIGTEAPEGYKWVPKGLLGDMAKYPERSDPGWAVRRLNDVNAAATTATVYIKPGHILTRAGTNAFANIMQGSALPRQVAHSVRVWKGLTHEERVDALAAAGQHGFDALPHEGGSPFGAAARAGSHWWAKHADAPFRFNSVAYEARKAGYAGVDGFRQWLHDLKNRESLPPEERARVEDVAKRANREQIAYDRMSHFEQTKMTRMLWFYPWTRAAVNYAGLSIYEHPLKTLALVQTGRVGAEQQHLELGDLSAINEGLFKVGGTRDNPVTLNWNTVLPYSTPAELFSTLRGNPGHFTLGSHLNPGLMALAQAAFELNPYGQSGHHFNPKSLGTSPFGATLPFTLWRDLHGGSKTFPIHSKKDAILHALMKPGGPRVLDRAAAERSAALERQQGR